MTISNTTNKVRTQGNGSNTAFSFSFKVVDQDDLEVYLVTRSTDAETIQTLGVDYTVSLNTVTEGGTVTMTTAPTSSQDVLIKRVLDLNQETDIPAVSKFPEVSIENEFDRSRMIDVQLKEELDRCLQLPVAEQNSLTIPVLADLDGKYLYISGTNLTGASLTITETAYSGAFDTGLDASKPASPSPGDLYFAYDTNKLYKCATVGQWTIDSNVNALDVAGAAEFDSTVTVNGATAVGGALTVTGTLDANGNAEVAGNLDVVGNIDLDGTLAFDAGTSINEFSIDGTLAGNSDDAVPTEKAVKTYADGLGVTVGAGSLTVSSTGNVAVTGLGFQPALVLFFFGRTSAGNGGPEGSGFMTSAAMFGHASHADNANQGSGVITSGVGGYEGNGSPEALKFTYVSMDSDGFTVNVSNADSNVTVQWVAIR